MIWQKLAPENAESIFNKLDYQTKKAIVEEQDKFGVNLDDYGVEQNINELAK